MKKAQHTDNSKATEKIIEDLRSSVSKMKEFMAGKDDLSYSQWIDQTENLIRSIASALAVENNPDKEQAAVTSSGLSGRNGSILLAEDDESMRIFLSKMLSDSYQVTCADNGKEALDMAKVINPDIVISDIIMPGMTGIEMCRIMKSSMETSHIPVILISALAEKEQIIQGLEAGADDYITKPFDIAVLKARIRNILLNRDKIRALFLSADTDVHQIEYTNKLDKDFLDKTIHIIEKEIDNPQFSVNDLCSSLGMSRTSAYNKIKSLTDQGPNDFIRIIRLNKANELIKTRKHTISEVSHLVGFSDPKYFSTCFKKQFGKSPSKA